MKNYLQIATRISAAILISISANTYAAGNVEAGNEKSQTCQGCHGMDGNSFSPEWPNLASQHPSYIIKQVHDFQSGTRQDPTMAPMVAGLSDEDLVDIAAYFHAQRVQPGEAAAAPNGEKLYRGGNSYTHVPACASCHGPQGVGNAPGNIPRLAGQKAAYTAKTLRNFKAGSRANDANNIMQEIAAKLSESEIDDLANYIAGMGKP